MLIERNINAMACLRGFQYENVTLLQFVTKGWKNDTIVAMCIDSQGKLQEIPKDKLIFDVD